MGHYAVLGVDAEASMGEIRAAYVELARAHHPDHHLGDERARLRAEARMREINAAWAVLGDVDARSTYDRERLSAAPPRSRPRHAAGFDTPDWKPYEAGPVAGFDERDDRPITSGGLPPWLQMAPPLLFVGGLSALVLGGFVGILPIVALGLAAVICSVGLFLVAPLVAMASSRREDTGA